MQLFDPFEQLEIALAAHAGGSEIGADMRYRHLMRAAFDDNRAQYAGFRHHDMVALLPFDAETVQFKNLNECAIVNRCDFRHTRPQAG